MKLKRHTDFSKTDQSLRSSAALSLDCASLCKRPCRFLPFTWIVNISTSLKVWDRHTLETGQQWHTHCETEQAWGWWDCPNSGHLTWEHPELQEVHQKPMVVSPGTHILPPQADAPVMGSHYILEDRSRYKMQKGQWRMRTAESKVSAALIVKLATHIWGNLITAPQQSTTKYTKEKCWDFKKKRRKAKSYSI